MKRLTLLILLFLTALPQWTMGQWTVQTVPNTRLQSNDIHVSDPDGYLSDSAEMNINTALCAIRQQADVFVVTLRSIGDAEPKRFATQLFNDWGIGDAQTNNGVLLLFVEDQHALEFETGYGAEATLTDARCERIFRNTIVPYFRRSDYEGGLCAGVADIVTVYGGEVPTGLMTALPESSSADDEDEPLDGGVVLLALVATMALLLPVVGFVFWLVKLKEKKEGKGERPTVEEEGVTYVDGIKAAWTGSPWVGRGCLGGLMIGFSIIIFFALGAAIMSVCFPESGDKGLYIGSSLIAIVLFLTWICFRQNQRALNTADRLSRQTINPKSVYKTAVEHWGTKVATWSAPWLGWIYYLIFKRRINQSEKCACPRCQSSLRKDSYFALPSIHEKESQLKALQFTPYRCANGHEIVLREKGSKYANFQTCPKCGAFTSMLTESKTVKKATYSQSGKKENTYVCQHCGEVLVTSVTIPQLVRYSGGGYSSSSSGRSHYGGSHHSSGGSFGGGHSGGGGYSGRW